MSRRCFCLGDFDVVEVKLNNCSDTEIVGGGGRMVGKRIVNFKCLAPKKWCAFENVPKMCLAVECPKGNGHELTLIHYFLLYIYTSV